MARLKKLLEKQSDKIVLGAASSIKNRGKINETVLNGPRTNSGTVEFPEWQILKDLMEDNVDHALSEQSSSQYVNFSSIFGLLKPC